MYILTIFYDYTQKLNEARNLIPIELKIPKENKWSIGINMDISKSIKYVFIHIYGTYSNIGGQKKLQVDNVYVYNSLNNRTSFVTNPFSNVIKEEMKNYNPNNLLLNKSVIEVFEKRMN